MDFVPMSGISKFRAYSGCTAEYFLGNAKWHEVCYRSQCNQMKIYAEATLLTPPPPLLLLLIVLFLRLLFVLIILGQWTNVLHKKAGILTLKLEWKEALAQQSRAAFEENHEEAGPRFFVAPRRKHPTGTAVNVFTSSLSAPTAFPRAKFAKYDINVKPPSPQPQFPPSRIMSQRTQRQRTQSRHTRLTESYRKFVAPENFYTSTLICFIQ
ncbi:unnamed protein product [Rodentolepis nana]|uniref:Uncharacterized protein n=1 Tax=Rodentolepis nana TaxID=102285 RepID=A0A0R3TDL9_RODNA|nr:unnamed protein product [Rodentolepis nana]